MRRILLTTDFSDNAWNAITYALNFLENEPCLFYILHTYTPAFYRADYMMGGASFSAIPDTGVAIALASLDKTLEDIKKKYPNKKHQFKTISAFNILTDEVREVVEKENIDLIVMGTQGATGAKEIFLGTHTVHVVRQSKKPVLVVPNAYKFKEIKSILFSSDYNSPIQKEELKLLIDLAKLQKATLEVLNVTEDFGLTDNQKTNKKSLDNYFKTIDHSFLQVKGKLIPEAIHEYVARHQIDLLVMMSHKHSFLERLISKSTVDKIGYHPIIPFLIIPYRSKEKIKQSKPL